MENLHSVESPEQTADGCGGEGLAMEAPSLVPCWGWQRAGGWGDIGGDLTG